MDSKERSCDCENCSMEESDATDGKLMCSKSCYPDSAFEELFLKIHLLSELSIYSYLICFLE